MDGEGGEKIGEPALELVEFVLHKDYRGQGIGTDKIGRASCRERVSSPV